MKITTFRVHEWVLAVAKILFGLILIIAGKPVIHWLVQLAGAFLVGWGIFQIIRYYRKEEDRSQYTLLFGAGIVMGILGLLILVRPGIVINFFPAVIGLVLFISGLNHILFYGPLFTDGRAYIFGTILAVLELIAGFLIFFHPGRLADFLIVLSGACLLFAGINGLLSYIMNKKR